MPKHQAIKDAQRKASRVRRTTGGNTAPTGSPPIRTTTGSKRQPPIAGTLPIPTKTTR